MPPRPKRTQIPFEGGSGRTPTGVMQFKNDWPGLFIRGDSAVPVLHAIRRLRKHCTDMEALEVQISLVALDRIAAIIEKDVIVTKEERDEFLQGPRR